MFTNNGPNSIFEGNRCSNPNYPMQQNECVATSSLFLAQLSKYADLSDEEQVLLLSCCNFENVNKKAVLLKENTVASAAYFVLKGCLYNYYQDEYGDKHVVQFAQEGSWITDFKSFYKARPSKTFVQALEDSCVVKIKRQDLYNLFAKVPKLERLYYKILSSALALATERVLDSLSKSAEERYVEFLKKFPGIGQRVPQYMVASYLGITPVFLSKLRAKVK